MAVKGEWIHWELLKLLLNPHNMTIKFLDRNGDGRLFYAAQGLNEAV